MQKIQIKPLHFTSLHFTSLHFTSLHFTSLHFKPSTTTTNYKSHNAMQSRAEQAAHHWKWGHLWDKQHSPCTGNGETSKQKKAIQLVVPPKDVSGIVRRHWIYDIWYLMLIMMMLEIFVLILKLLAQVLGKQWLQGFKFGFWLWG